MILSEEERSEILSFNIQDRKNKRANTLEESKISLTVHRKSSKKTEKKLRHSSPLLVLVLIILIVFVVYTILQYEEDISKSQVTNNSKPQGIDCDESNVLRIGDGLCDEDTNVEQCQFDGEDCCLSHKSTPFCHNCTCKMKIDQTELKANLTVFDVKVFTCNSNYTDVVLEKDVVSIQDVESLDVCATLCMSKTKFETKINGWMLDSQSMQCFCSFFDAALCKVIYQETELTTYNGHYQNAFGFVMLSKMLDCGEFVLDIGRPMIGENPGLIEALWTPGPWYCRLWCLEHTNSSCNTYMWIPDITLDGKDSSRIGNCFLYMDGGEAQSLDCPGAVLGTLDDVGYQNLKNESLVGEKTCSKQTVQATSEAYCTANVLLVVGGVLSRSDEEPVEVKNLDDPGFTCDVTLPESQLEINLYSHDIFSGGILGANVPVMCGGLNKIGQTKDDCMTLNGSDPTETPVLWVTGGTYSNHFFLSTTDLITLSQTKNGPDIPRASTGHCLVRAEHNNDNHIVLIGGVTALALGSYRFESSIYIYDWISENWEEGPPMLFKTAFGACGGILGQQDGSYLIVVANGDEGWGRATQILTTSNAEKSTWQWTSGPEMPNSIMYANGVVSFDSKHLFVIGGEGPYQYPQDTIYKFSCIKLHNCEWSLSDEQLSNARFAAVAMLLPDSLTESF